jgi:hypothetical protein
VRTRILLTTLALSLLALNLTQAPALGDALDGTGGYTTPDGGHVVVVVPGSDADGYVGVGYSPGSGSGGASEVECRYFAVITPGNAVIPNVGAQITDTSALVAGDLLWLICRDITAGTTTYENIFHWDPATPQAVVPSAAVLAQMAANDMTVPVPGVETWPAAGGKGLVNLPVWLHVDNWTTLTASASAGGVTATVEAVPVRVVWDMDAGGVTCADAGPRYDPATRPDPASSTCSFTYSQSSGERADLTFHNSATVVWHLRWFATNGRGGDLGELSSRVAHFDLQIEESQALVAPAPG